MSVVRVEHVSKEYHLGEQTVKALDDVSLQSRRSLPGHRRPSAAASPRLLNLIGCIDTPNRGRIEIDGRDVSNRTPDELADLRARSIGFIFQTFNLMPVLSAAENVEYPLLQLPELSRRERREIVGIFLGVVGLTATPANGRTSSAAANASGWRSPAPWRRGRASCWPTSRPPTSTTRPAKAS